MVTTSNHNTNTISKALSIQINLSGLSFCVLNCDTNTILHLETVNFSETKNPETLLDAIKTVFNTYPALDDTFKDITAIHQNPWQTLVPKALFNKEYITDYLKFNTKILAGDFVDFDTIPLIEAHTVYVPFTNINNYIFEQFGSFVYKHSATLILEHLAKTEKNKTSDAVYVNIEALSFDIIIFKKGTLQLFNSFEYSNDQDFIYYILFTFEQLLLNPETTKTYLTGRILEQDSLYKIAYTYIRHISIYRAKRSFNFGETPKFPQYYFNLLNSLSCE
jgi:hypothetical protein